MDDIVLTESNQTHIQEIVTTMGNEFSLKELDDLGYFLGIQVKECKEGLHLSQQRIRDIW